MLPRMNVSSSIPVYDAIFTFSQATRHMGLRYSEFWVRGRFGLHQNPNSLLAVIELAPAFGLIPTACQCDPDILKEQGLPAILYLNVSGVQGFGTFLYVEDEEYVIVSGESGEYRLQREELMQIWGGIAVFLERSEDRGEVERGYYLRRSWEEMNRVYKAARRRFPQLEELGSGSRLAGILLLVTLVCISVVRSSHVSERWTWAPIVLAITTGLGILLAAMLYKVSRGVRDPDSRGLSEKLCGGTGLVDCDSVLHSRWAGIGKWSLASLGLAWFTSSWILIACGAMVQLVPERLFLWLGLMYIAACPLSLLLIVVQFWPLVRICPLCMGVHGLVIGAAAAGWFGLVHPRDFLASDVWPFAAVHAGILLLVLGFVFPWLEARSNLQTLRRAMGRATATPLGALAITAAAPQHDTKALTGALFWGDRTAPVRVDIFINPLCLPCGPVIDQMLNVFKRHESKFHLAFHLAPKTGANVEGDRQLVTALTAIGLLVGRDQGLQAFSTAKNEGHKWLRKVLADPREMIASFTVVPPDVPLDEVMGRAREITREVEKTVRRAYVGIPAVFIGGRYFDAPVEQFTALLADNYELLVRSLGSESRPDR